MSYKWIVVSGGISAGALAWGIGANDLANAFGTTYGSGVLTQRQISVLASFCEFGGAFALGSEVTKTIAGNITSTSLFVLQPYVFMYGMLSALIAATIWLYLATYAGLAVSTTHSIIGGILGFALVYGGGNAIHWMEPIPEFPFTSGIVPIVISWFSSPLLTAAIGAGIFGSLRAIVLRSSNSTKRAMYTFPVLAVITSWINVFFVLSKGAKARLDWSIEHSSWISGVAAVGVGLLCVLVTPSMQRKIQKEAEARTRCHVEDGAREAQGNKDEDTVLATVQYPDVELFHPDTESYFKYLQVFTAMCMSFAHGANDVSNAIGPFAAIWNIYESGKISSANAVPLWMLAVGGSGLVLGLSVHGLRIMEALGTKMTTITPTRGFSAELATGLVVSFASSYGMPISTTHCITGAILGVGLVDGTSHINWKLVMKTFTAWIVTLIATGVLSAAIFAQGVYAPSVR